jgi:hypothetical protein
MVRRVLVFLTLSVLLISTVGLAAPSPFSLYYDVAGIAQPAEAVIAAPLSAGITAMELTRGPGIRKATLTNGFSAEGWDSAPSRDASLTVGAYFQWGFTVQSGFSASLATLDMSLRRSAVVAPMNMEVQVSFDGFATPGIKVAEFNYFGRTSGTHPNPDPLIADPFLYMQNDVPGQPNSTTSPGDPIPTIDLRQVSALQNLPAGAAVTFRLYAWGNGQGTSTNTLALGRMVGPKVEGTVAGQ